MMVPVSDQSPGVARLTVPLQAVPSGVTLVPVNEAGPRGDQPDTKGLLASTM